MRKTGYTMLITMVLVAGFAAAEAPYDSWTNLPPGAQPADPSVENPNEVGNTEALQFWNDRAAFEAAFPGLPTEDWGNTLVAPGGITSCPPPFNETTNNACFAPGGILPGIELNVNIVTGTGDLVVLGVGAFGNVNVLCGPNSFGDNMVLNFNPAVRAAGLDFVNPIAPGNSYNVEIFGTGGSLGFATVTDGPEGTFWGVDSTDVGGITSIVFDGAGLDTHSELSALVIFGGTPVPVELQSISVE